MQEMRTGQEIRAELETARGPPEMRALGEGLRREMSHLNDQTLTHVRVLHEAVIERIAQLDDARNGSARKRKRR